MPAPTPIQIRYGPAGLLAQAVAQAGSNEGSQDRDFQFINSMMNRTDRMAQTYAQNNASANQLQQAYASHTGQQPVTQDYYGNGADAANASLLKNVYLQSASADLPDEEKANLTVLAKARNVSPDQFRLAVSDAAKRSAETKDATSDIAGKKAYVDSIINNIPEKERAGLQSMVNAKDVKLPQLRVAADAALQRGSVLPRTQLAFQLSGIDEQARVLKSHMETITRSLGKDGINPEVATPAQLNPTYGTAGAPDFVRNSAQGLTLGKYKPNDVTPGNVDSRAAYMTYHRIKAEFTALMQKRQQLLDASGAAPAPAAAQAAAPAGGGGSISINPEGGWPVAEDASAGVTIGQQQQPAAPKQLTPQIAAQFLQQAQGHKDLARQMAAQQGFTF